ncbi:MAG: hypothetical protein ACODAF_04445 [Actinomycetota bacterium]
MTSRPLRATVGTSRAHEEYGGRRRWFLLVVYDTRAELAAAAARYKPWETFDGDTGACVQPSPRRYDVDSDRIVPSRNGYLGIIRLCRELADAEVVSHEAVHAALVVYRADIRRFAHLGDGCGDREETLAYLVGDLAAAMVDALYDLGVWARPARD